MATKEIKDFSAVSTPAVADIVVVQQDTDDVFRKLTLAQIFNLALRPPGGRLTLTTATPVMSAEGANQTTIYYTPFVNDLAPIYDGTRWTMTTFAELSIGMAAHANWAANKNFDLYVYNDADTMRLVTGAAWTNDTTRAEALVRTNGIFLNSPAITGRYATGSTVAIAASRATYVGTVRTTSVTGTTTMEFGGAEVGGNPGFLYLWNAYHRVPLNITVVDGTDSWTYTTLTWRSRNGSNSNRVSLVRGLNEDGVWATLLSGALNGLADIAIFAGIGLDVTTAPTGIFSKTHTPGTSSATQLSAAYSGFPGLGLHYLQALEMSAATNTTTWTGDLGLPTDLAFGLAIRLTL